MEVEENIINSVTDSESCKNFINKNILIQLTDKNQRKLKSLDQKVQFLGQQM